MAERDFKETILVVDDTPANLDILFHYLDHADYNVLLATDGKEAIDKANRFRPDLILLDVMMPGLDGFQTCQQLKGSLETADVPIIFMTALASTTDKVRGFEVGAIDYITKPLQYRELLARVNTHLTIQRLKSRQQEYILELEQRNQELDTFARTVAHNLKNPLNAVLNAAEILEEFVTLPEDMRPHLDTIVELSYQMSNTTDALLLLSHIRRETIEHQPLNMADIVGRSQTQLSSLREKYQATIITPDSWPQAVGYAPWVQEIWSNYISNAIKYGGRPPTVTLSAAAQPDGFIKFAVQDDGPGLSAEEQGQLFTEFTRLKQAQGQSGHGLGLSIVRSITTRLDGKVGVESQIGQGSTFYFTLPAA